MSLCGRHRAALWHSLAHLARRLIEAFEEGQKGRSVHAMPPRIVS
jgi:hypothetical protein